MFYTWSEVEYISSFKNYCQTGGVRGEFGKRPDFSGFWFVHPSLMQVVPPGGQYWRLCPGSVVPLAMFFPESCDSSNPTSATKDDEWYLVNRCQRNSGLRQCAGGSTMCPRLYFAAMRFIHVSQTVVCKQICLIVNHPLVWAHTPSWEKHWHQESIP